MTPLRKCHEAHINEAQQKEPQGRQMHNKPSYRRPYAVSEVIAVLLLVVIALAAFAVIYLRVFPLPMPSHQSNIKIAGYVNETATPILQHVGGTTITDYDILVTQGQDSVAYHHTDPWQMGDTIPLTDYHLAPDELINVTVVNRNTDGTTEIIFQGTLKPKPTPPGPVPHILDPMSISTLLTDTPDEDLICYSYTIHPSIFPLPTTYIYNWMRYNGGAYTPRACLLLPFDTQTTDTTKDYSTLNHNGTITGPTWTQNGRLGGAYQYSGHDAITLPYPFSTSTLTQVTIQAWFKTTQASGTILSYNRSDYFELAVSDSRLKWSTTASDGTKDLLGTRTVTDNLWHHATATYDATTGTATLYLDGLQDATTQAHTPGRPLGSGDQPAGKIGTGTGPSTRRPLFTTGFETTAEHDTWKEQNTSGSQTPTWSTLRYDNFNTGWGNYIPGSNGSSADAYRSTTYKHEGTASAGIRDDSGVASSFRLTTPIDMDTPAYKSLKIDFWWMWRGNTWSTGKTWWLQYYNGTAWTNILTVTYPSGYATSTWYHSIVYVNESTYRFPTNMFIRFMCNADGDNSQVYIDQLYLNATSYGRLECDFDLLPTTILVPHTGSYSLGGTGDFDPEYAIYNRTAIPLTGYKDFEISFWYSRKNTAAADFFGLYYRNNSQWIPLYEISNPTYSGQSPWTKVTITLPRALTSLKLQFKWRTGALTSFFAIDDLEVTGIPLGGENNFTGTIDDIKIYPTVLPSEQCYQDCLCSCTGSSDRSVLVSESLSLGQTWVCRVTPNNSIRDDLYSESLSLLIHHYIGG